MTTHSFSSIDFFSSCAHKYNEVKIVKRFKEKPFVASELGKALHSAFERAITMGVSLPENLIRYTPEIEMLKALPGAKHCEMKLALTHQGTATEFWAKDAWIRGAADFIHIDGTHAMIADYKTGKVNPKPDQLHLMACMVFQRFPWVKTVRGVLMFVEHSVIHTEDYDAVNFPQMFGFWANKMNRIEKAIDTQQFPKNPSGLCKNHCAVANCEHNGMGGVL
jgi:hypothetical protein